MNLPLSARRGNFGVWYPKNTNPQRMPERIQKRDAGDAVLTISLKKGTKVSKMVRVNIARMTLKVTRD